MITTYPLKPFTKKPNKNRQRIHKTWQRRATSFVNHNFFMERLAMDLDDRLTGIKLTPQHILDLGSRTPHTSDHLRQRYPKAKLIQMAPAEAFIPLIREKKRLFRKRSPALVGEERLPFANQSFDLILSNMFIHWSSHPQKLFKEIKRILKPEGMLFFTMIGANTLKELRFCQQQNQTDPNTPETTLAAPDIHQLGDLLHASRLALAVIDREQGAFFLHQAEELWSMLRQFGAINPYPLSTPGVSGRNRLKQILHCYKSNFKDPKGRFPVTLEVFFGHAVHTRTTAYKSSI
ncbi:methyltransferase domain-containing protein [Magnetococcales bacterium HHB-1]